MNCSCVGVRMGTYEAAVVVKLPWRDKLVSIDSCILPIIQELWSLGIRTYGCCCGHNLVPGMVNVDESDGDRMRALGFESMLDAPYPESTFYIWR